MLSSSERISSEWHTGYTVAFRIKETKSDIAPADLEMETDSVEVEWLDTGYSIIIDRI